MSELFHRPMLQAPATIHPEVFFESARLRLAEPCVL